VADNIQGFLKSHNDKTRRLGPRPIVVRFLRSPRMWQSLAIMDRDLARRVSHMALRQPRVCEEALVHHTDRGNPYASDDYRPHLSHHAILPGTSRSGNCCDNALVEGFMSTLKMGPVPTERLLNARAGSPGGFRIHQRVLYNTWRTHSSPGHLSPDEFKRQRSVQA